MHTTYDLLKHHTHILSWLSKSEDAYNLTSISFALNLDGGLSNPFTHPIHVLHDELRNALSKVQLSVVGDGFDGEFLQELGSQLLLLGLDHPGDLVVVWIGSGSLPLNVYGVLDILHFLLRLSRDDLFVHLNLADFSLRLGINLGLESFGLRVLLFNPLLLLSYQQLRLRCLYLLIILQ